MFQVQDYFKQEIRFKEYVIIIKQATLKYKLSSYCDTGAALYQLKLRL